MIKRDEYVEKLKSQLDQWNAELARLETKAKEAQTGLQSEYVRQLEAFRSLRDLALKQLRLLEFAAGDAWMDLTRGADEAWAKMREAFDQAQSHFKK